MDNDVPKQDVVENNAVALFGDTTLRETVRLLPRYRKARNGDMLYLSKERAYYL